MSDDTVDLKALRRATELRPGDPDAHVALVLGLQDASGDAAATETALDETIGAFTRAWEIGQAALDATIERSFTELLAGLRTDAHRARVSLAHAALLTKRVSAADQTDVPRIIALIEAALRDAEGDGAALLGAATLALHVGRSAEVVQWFQQYGTPGADGLALLVLARLQLGDGAAALAAGYEGLALAPESALLLNAMVSTALALGLTDEADTLVARALDVAPGRLDILLNLAATHQQAGRLAAALGVLDGLVAVGELPETYASWHASIRAELFAA